MLDNLPRDLPLKHESELVPSRGFSINNLIRHPRNSRINVRGSIPLIQVDLKGSPKVTSERGVVLETVAGSVLVDRKSRAEFSWIGRTQSGGELETCSEALPRIFSRKPPARTLRKSKEVNHQNATIKKEIYSLLEDYQPSRKRAPSSP